LARVGIILANRANGWGSGACGAEVTSRAAGTGHVIGGVRNRCANNSSSRAVMALGAITTGGGHASVCAELTSRAGSALSHGSEASGSRESTLGAGSRPCAASGAVRTGGASPVLSSGRTEWAVIASVALANRIDKTGTVAIHAGEAKRTLRAQTQRSDIVKVANRARVLLGVSIPARAIEARRARERGGGVIVVAEGPSRARSAGRLAIVGVKLAKRAD